MTFARTLFFGLVFCTLTAAAADAEEEAFPPSPRLVQAAREGDILFVKKWIRRGMDANAVSAWAESALHAAASGNQIETIRYLISSGAEIEARDFLGRTPLLIAVEKSFPGSAAVLWANGAELNCRDSFQQTPLLVVVRNQHLFLTKKLLEEGAHPNVYDVRTNSPLHLAAAMNHPTIVKTLLAYGADPSPVDSRGRTPLHLTALQTNAFAQWVEAGAAFFFGNAPGNGETEKVEWMEAASFKIAKLLLDDGAAIEARDAENRTPLAVAASQGRIDLVRLLLARGANPGVWTEKSQNTGKSLESECRNANFPRIKSLLNRLPEPATPKPGTLIK